MKPDTDWQNTDWNEILAPIVRKLQAPSIADTDVTLSPDASKAVAKLVADLGKALDSQHRFIVSSLRYERQQSLIFWLTWAGLVLATSYLFLAS